VDAAASHGRLVEFKTVNARNRPLIDQLGEPGTDEIPVTWMWQVQWQLFVADDDRADLLVMVGGDEPALYEIGRNQKLIAHALGRAARFWDLVRSETPPPPTSPEDCRHLAVLYRECRGEVELPAEITHVADVYDRAGAEVRYHQRLRDEARLDMLAALGPADVGRLPDGRIVRRSVVEVKAHEVRAGTQVRLSIKGG
jgi:predicted phage-related endonuclease